MNVPSRIKTFAFIGPSGAGKSHLANILVERLPDISLVRSYTTRPKRSSTDESHVFVDQKKFVELEKQQVFVGTYNAFGYSYGLPKSDDSNRRLILIRAPLVNRFRQLFSNPVVIEIDAPIETLSERLNVRGDQSRIDKDALASEIEAGRKLADYIINSSQSTEQCIKQITKIIC